MRGIAVIAVLGASLIAGSTPAQETSADYPYVVEERNTRWELSADGTGQTRMRARFRIQNEGGVQILGQILEPYLVGRVHLTVQGLRVRHRDGSVHDLQPQDVRDLPAPVTAAFPVYSDLHVLHITPPGLRSGDIVDLELLWDILQPDAPGHFWVEHGFIRNTVVESEVLEVLVPETTPVRLRTADDLEPEIERVAGNRLYRWTYSQDHVDVAKDASFDPRAILKRPDVELTSFPDWQAVGDWYAGLALDRARPDRQIRRKAEELTDGLSKDRDRIAALYDFVRRNIRYLGLHFGLARYRPNGAAETLANGYGDCKDKHTLLAALLEAAGYRAWPVAVGTLREPTPDVPSPAQFDHLITAVQLDDETLWLDSTETVHPFGYVSVAARGKEALLVKADGQSRLIEIPRSLPYAAFETTRLVGRVDRNGTLEGTVTYEGRGDGEPMVRAALLNTAGDQRNEIGKRVLDVLDIEADLENFEASDPADTSEAVRITMTIQKEDFIAPFKENQEMRLPSIAGHLVEADDEDEDEEVFLGNPTRFTFELDLTFPDGTRLEPPLPVALERNFASMRSQFEVSGGHITGARSLDVLVQELTSEHRGAYEQFHSAMRSDGNQTLGLTFPKGVLAASAEAEDADRLYRAGRDAYQREDFEGAIQLFERAAELEPDHEDAWEELGRSLVKAERVEEAVEAMRRQLEVTPHHATIRTTLGWALEEAGDTEAAVDAYHEQLKVDPSNTYSTDRLGRLLQSLSRCEESLPYLRRAARNDPDDASLTWRLADCELHAGEAERSVSLFESLQGADDAEVLKEALRDMIDHGHHEQLGPLIVHLEHLAPERSSTWMIRGRLARATEQDENARADFARALELEPDNAEARIQLAAALYRLHRYTDAIPIYQEYLEQRPEDMDARYWLGDALFLNGDAEGSIQELESVIDAQPEELRAWIGLARARLAVGDPVGASEAAQRAREAAPDDHEIQWGLAELLRLAGRHAEAKSLILGLYNERERHDLPCGPFAWSLFHSEAYLEAEAMAQECLAGNAGEVHALHTLGLNFARQGRYDEALPRLEQAAELFSGEFPDLAVLDYVRQQVATSNEGNVSGDSP